jgi:hypothetical protein
LGKRIHRRRIQREGKSITAPISHQLARMQEH